MSIKPILFNTPMVRAILDGRKSCTRRIVKSQPQGRLCYTFAGGNCGTWGYPSKTAYENWGDEYKLPEDITDEELKRRWNPPYHTDDILYVRETFIQAAAHTFWYKANFELWMPEGLRWKPSIHMPKEAARIWLKVTDVRVERLQEITETQAQSEGCNSGLLTGACTARGQFEALWNSTIKKSDLDYYGWSANPWVWVIEFERCERGGVDER